jgi:hypothetical protein
VRGSIEYELVDTNPHEREDIPSVWQGTLVILYGVLDESLKVGAELGQGLIR